MLGLHARKVSAMYRAIITFGVPLLLLAGAIGCHGDLPGYDEEASRLLTEQLAEDIKEFQVANDCTLQPWRTITMKPLDAQDDPQTARVELLFREASGKDQFYTWEYQRTQSGWVRSSITAGLRKPG